MVGDKVLLARLHKQLIAYCLNKLGTNGPQDLLVSETLRSLVAPLLHSGRYSPARAFGFLKPVDPLVLVPHLYLIVSVSNLYLAITPYVCILAGGCPPTKHL